VLQVGTPVVIVRLGYVQILVTVANNNNNDDNVYGALIMTKAVARVHSVHLMNVD